MAPNTTKPTCATCGQLASHPLHAGIAMVREGVHQFKPTEAPAPAAPSVEDMHSMALEVELLRRGPRRKQPFSKGFHRGWSHGYSAGYYQAVDDAAARVPGGAAGEELAAIRVVADDHTMYAENRIARIVELLAAARAPGPVGGEAEALQVHASALAAVDGEYIEHLKGLLQHAVDPVGVFGGGTEVGASCGGGATGPGEAGARVELGRQPVDGDGTDDLRQRSSQRRRSRR